MSAIGPQRQAVDGQADPQADGGHPRRVVDQLGTREVGIELSEHHEPDPELGERDGQGQPLGDARLARGEEGDEDPPRPAAARAG